MKAVIYADVLVAVNFVIAWGLLMATGRLCGAPVRGWRLVLASAIGGASSLLLLADTLPWTVSAACKLGCCVAGVAAAFAGRGVRCLVRCGLWYALLNFFLAGVVFFAVEWLGLTGVNQNNLNIYFDVSPILLIACVICVYVGLELFALFFRPPATEQTIQAEIFLTPAIKLRAVALYDTGFALKDVFTGTAAVLVSYPAVSRQLPMPVQRILRRYFEEGDISEGIHLIPYSTAGDSGVLPAMFSSSLILRSAGKTLRFTDTSIAFTKQTLAHGQYAALIGPELAGQLI